MNETKDNSSLPEGWKWVRFGEAVNNVDGKRIPLSREVRAKRKGVFRYYGATEIVDYIDDYIFEGEYLLVGEDGANLLSKSKPIAFIVSGKFWVNNHAHVLQAKPTFRNKYLCYYFNSLNISKFVTGTAQPKLSQGNLNKIEIPSCSIEVQQAIVSKLEELFSELDKSIETLRLAQQQLKTYRQAVLKWAFEGKLTEEWRKENRTTVRVPAGSQKQIQAGVLSGLLPNSIAAEPIADYQIIANNFKNGVLPDGWNWVGLSEVCEIKRGKSKHRPRNEPALYGGIYPFIQTGDIRNSSGKYITEYTQTYSELGLQQSKLWPKGTLCITIAANIGETAILGFDACFPDSVVGLLCDEKQLLNKYANYFFISFKHKLEELAPATAQKNINVDILEKVIIPLAPIAEQYNVIEEIESRLSVADKMEESITQSLQQAEALRQSILKKAFEGKLIVEKKLVVYKPKSEYFYQVQLLGLIARASKKKDIAHGEMTIAKYAYLVDKVYGVPTYYDYKRWHLGPYPPEIKKAINNKKFLKKQNGNLEVADEESLFKYNNHYQEEIESAVADLAEIFSKYSAKERAHKTELLATICKIVEDIQIIDLQAVRASMRDWKIELETSSSKNKAEKFTELETEKCLAFIVERAWSNRLVKEY